MVRIGTSESDLENRSQEFCVEALATVLRPEWVNDAIAEGCTGKDRGRWLKWGRTLWLVVLMGLHRRRSYRSLLRLGFGTWWAKRFGEKRPLESSALTKARDRLGVEPLRILFGRSAATWVNGSSGLIAGGRRVLTLDGQTYKTPDSPENRAYFGLPGSKRGRSGYPQFRTVHLMDVETRICRDFEAGPYADAEVTLTRRLLGRLPAGSLLLMDRNFTAFDVLWTIASSASDFIVRAKKNMKPGLVRTLSAGDDLVEFAPTRSVLNQHPHLPQTWRLRHITVELDGGKEPLHLITSVLDPTRLSKEEVTRLYLLRWEHETANDEFKTHLAECATVNRPEVVRSKTPERVKQELYGLVIAYNAVRKIMADCVSPAVGVSTSLPPTRLSFVAALDIVRVTCHDMARLPTQLLLGRYRQLLELIPLYPVPLRPGRKVRREVKIHVSKYPVKSYGEKACAA